jgi:WxL domain surface cell wall-binding
MRRVRLPAAVAAIAAALVAINPVAAADTVTQLITPGARSASVANASLGSVAYSHSTQTSTGTLTLTADDSTGSNLGWNVTVQSSAFVYSGGNGGTNIPAANFSLTSAGAPSATAGQAVDNVGGPKVPAISPLGSLDTARKTVQALPLFGKGTYTQALGVTLNVPAESAAGTYTATLTTTIAAGP